MTERKGGGIREKVVNKVAGVEKQRLFNSDAKNAKVNHTLERRFREMKNRKGFTLVEIMIVVAIIALLATIALPGLLRTRVAANEASAIAGLRTLGTTAETYRTTQSPAIYPGKIGDLAGATPPYITGFVVAAGTACVTASTACRKAGYEFGVSSVAADTSNQYSAVGAPITVGTTGSRYFCIDHTGVMRQGTAAADFSAGTACDTAKGIVSQ